MGHVPRRKTFPLRLRDETRTAALMLSEIQADGGGPYQGLQFWVNDLVDAVSAKLFFDTFGISVQEFLSRCRDRSDVQLREAARRLLERKYATIGTMPADIA